LSTDGSSWGRGSSSSNEEIVVTVVNSVVVTSIRVGGSNAWLVVVLVSSKEVGEKLSVDSNLSISVDGSSSGVVDIVNYSGFNADRGVVSVETLNEIGWERAWSWLCNGEVSESVVVRQWLCWNGFSSPDLRNSGSWLGDQISSNKLSSI